jgi:hypothetical protein
MVDLVVEVVIEVVIQEVQVIHLLQTHLKETMEELQLIFQELVVVVQLEQDQMVRVQRVELEVQEHLTQF